MTNETNTGVAKYRAKQRRFWMIVGGGTLAFAAIAAVIGFPVGYAEGAGVPVQTYVSAPIAWALAAVLLVGFWAMSYYYITRADEVEVQHNLWANSWALYFYLGLSMAWEALHRLEAAPAVDALIVFFATLTVSIVAYWVRRYWPR